MAQSSALAGGLGSGEFLVFLSVFCWSGTILIADVATKRANVLALTLVDFVLTTCVSLPLAMYEEPGQWHWLMLWLGLSTEATGGDEGGDGGVVGEVGDVLQEVLDNWDVIVITGVTAVLAVSLANLGQVHTPATRAALLFSLEAVATALLGWGMLGESMGAPELIGAAVMTASTVRAC